VFYQGFVSRVADARHRKYDEVEPLAQGRVWLGAQAKKNGLVDELGGLDRALELVKDKANIPASQNVTVVSYPPRKSLFEYLFNRNDEVTGIDSTIRALTGRLPIRSLIQGGMLKLMPYSIEVK
jgi:protease-4